MANSPNGGLINETNEQYYAGTQSNIVSYTNAVMDSMVYTFNEVLEMGSSTSWSPSDPDYDQNNFILEISPNGVSPYVTYTGNPVGSGTGGGYYIQKFSNTQPYSVLKFTNADAIPANYYVRVKLKSSLIDGGPNYGDYQYISIFEIVNNFMVGYVGSDKIIQKVKRSDVLFYAKRGLQEFSYDTLRSVKSQDYVNYVNLSWVDKSGVKHIIYPTTLTSNPTETPIQDNNIGSNPFGFNFPTSGHGIPIQDTHGENLESTSLTEEMWANQKPFDDPVIEPVFAEGIGDSIYARREIALLGQRYGLHPEISNSNGWFTHNKREGKFSFSSNLGGKLILLEYISDGLAYEEDTKIPKLAEEALYMHIAYNILAHKKNIPEYIIHRYKKERFDSVSSCYERKSRVYVSG